jgi:hypothetical protein
MSGVGYYFQAPASCPFPLPGYFPRTRPPDANTFGPRCSITVFCLLVCLASGSLMSGWEDLGLVPVPHSWPCPVLLGSGLWAAGSPWSGMPTLSTLIIPACPPSQQETLVYCAIEAMSLVTCSAVIAISHETVSCHSNTTQSCWFAVLFGNLFIVTNTLSGKYWCPFKYGILTGFL